MASRVLARPAPSAAKSKNGKRPTNGKPVAAITGKALTKSLLKTTPVTALVKSRNAQPAAAMPAKHSAATPLAGANGAAKAVADKAKAPARARPQISNAKRNEQRTNQALSESRPELPAARKTRSISERAAAAREADEQNQKLINNRPSAIPTDTKPRKNTAGLSHRELEFYRDLLLAKRRELVGDMSSMEREALRTTGGSNLSNLPIHMADMGTDNYEQEFTLGLMEKDRRLLRDINAALGKIQDGSYGICEGTGKPISKPRLEAQPWARYSIEHARKLERHMVR
jgi:RNA polymerase-binding protein DksA